MGPPQKRRKRDEKSDYKQNDNSCIQTRSRSG